MVLATIDEQFKKLILLNNEHDLILFKPLEQKQMHWCGSWCKTNKHIETCKYKFFIIILVEHVAQHPITQRWVEKKFKSIVGFLNLKLVGYYHLYICASNNH